MISCEYLNRAFYYINTIDNEGESIILLRKGFRLEASLTISELNRVKQENKDTIENADIDFYKKIRMYCKAIIDCTRRLYQSSHASYFIESKHYVTMFHDEVRIYDNENNAIITSKIYGSDLWFFIKNQQTRGLSRRTVSNKEYYLFIRNIITLFNSLKELLKYYNITF